MGSLVVTASTSKVQMKSIDRDIINDAVRNVQTYAERTYTRLKALRYLD